MLGIYLTGYNLQKFLVWRGIVRNQVPLSLLVKERQKSSNFFVIIDSILPVNAHPRMSLAFLDARDILGGKQRTSALNN